MALKEINLPQVNGYPTTNGTVGMSEYEFTTITHLLQEYTQKYSRLLDEYIRPIRYTPFYIAVAVGTILIASFNVLKDNKQGLLWDIFLVGTGSIQLILMLVTFFQLIYLVYQQWKRQRMTSQAASVFLKGRLQNIVRTASQMYEHSPLTIVQKLELDLRLAEAEMTLQLGEKIR